MTTLWDALGRPPPDNPLPRATSLAWAEARRALRRSLRGIGGTGTWRSPGMLWAATRGESLPVGRTWGQLCDGITLLHVREAERRGTAGIAMKAASWNVRWMLDPHTTVAAAKRAVILRLLGEGCVVLLQETHWTEAACATWGGCFPMAEVRASAARPGANGGLCGGVAILVPARYRIVTHQVISDGCCIEVLCAERNGGGTVTYRSTYLPPSARSSVLTEIRRCGHPQTDLVVGGDVNMCITGPRDEAEAEETQTLLEWAAEHGATALPIGGPTHRGPFGCTQLDWIAVPTQGTGSGTHSLGGTVGSRTTLAWLHRGPGHRLPQGGTATPHRWRCCPQQRSPTCA